MEVVEILLSAGADPMATNNLGMDAVGMSWNYPALRGLLQKRRRALRFNKSTILQSTLELEEESVVLGKRISTATNLHHDMWLMSMSTLLRLYGKAGKREVMEPHQQLMQRGDLIRWINVPSDAEIVFVSHEWLSFAHPDPDGTKLRVLCRVLERLKEGDIERVDMSPMHAMLYNQNFTILSQDWKNMLRRTYLWIDWCSMPQPSAESVEEIGQERMADLRERGSRAIRSIPAYVERSDFMMILAPPGEHKDRGIEDEDTCYRTWRRRGWCLLELFASFMSRDVTNPPLLVRSEKGTPTWVSPSDATNMCVGHAKFTCCERNHTCTTETQKIIHGLDTKEDVDEEEELCLTIPCDKPVAGGIMTRLLEAKVYDMFNMNKDVKRARLLKCMSWWWLRDLEDGWTTQKDKYRTEREKKEQEKKELLLERDRKEKQKRKKYRHKMYVQKGRRWKDPEQEEIQKKLEAEKKRIQEEGDEEDQVMKKPELTAEEKVAQRKVDNESLREFKDKHMQWDESTKDTKWFDRHGVGILFYAVLMNDLRVVRELLNLLNEEFPSQGEQYNEIIESRLDSDGVLSLGLAGNASTLLIAMAFAEPDIVTLLVENGANKDSVDIFGNTTLHYCGIRGNVSSYERYVKLDTRYNIHDRPNHQGNSPLNEALFQGANKMKIIT
eukprot:g415.t1